MQRVARYQCRFEVNLCRFAQNLCRFALALLFPLSFLVSWTSLGACVSRLEGSEPILVADFEGESYQNWKVTGAAFGKGPARGTLPGQMQVEGFQGKGLVNSFLGGDDATGTLVSPEFKIERRFMTFLIGGGGWADETCMNLLLDGKVVRTATGSNTNAGGTERLEPAAWDLKELLGKKVVIAIVDQRKGGWGHINVDQIVQCDDRGSIPIFVQPTPLRKDVSREIAIEKKLLHFPIKNGAKPRVVTIQVDGVSQLRFDIGLADGDADWWAPLDVSAWSGKKAKIAVNLLPEDSKALDSIQASDTMIGIEGLYREPLRSQHHFSPMRGWTNDPNGLVFFQNEYHLFFQHNPYGWDWGNMHWGHATSRDLIHWQELGEALYPDDMGPMFSGSAVVDWNNTSGFGKDDEPPLVLIYTAAGNPTTQCIAYSLDGRKFTKYDKNPVIQQISPGNRDPKVFWYEPAKHWVQVLYVEMPGKKHTIHFFTSKNLREWKLASIAEGGIDGDKYLFECPDFFELPVDGDSSKKKWVLNAANSEYAIGTFDGVTFKPESSRLADVKGRGFYAAQTFSDTPDKRRIQIGWIQAPSPGMSFNQLQSIPCELNLKSTADGIRLHRSPVKELQSLREGTDQSKKLMDFRSDCFELLAEFDSKKSKSVEFTLRGAKVAYDASTQELTVNDYRVAAPLIEGKQRLHIFFDRTMMEIFASDGLVYVPFPFLPKIDELSIAYKVDSGKLDSLELYKLKSIWPSNPKLSAELRAMGEEDQKLRGLLQNALVAGTKPTPEYMEAAKKQSEIDAANMKRLESIVQENGWPGRSMVGDSASQAAFLILQHSQLESQVKFMPLLQEAAKQREARPADVAMLEDRVLMRQGKKQVYGTQLFSNESTGGKLVLHPIEDEEHVDERRASVGMMPLKEYLKLFGIDK